MDTGVGVIIFNLGAYTCIDAGICVIGTFIFDGAMLVDL